jgi:hypothetical protein
MFQNVILVSLMLILIGCGADSDLLRDENVASEPKGSAYEVLSSKVYKFTKPDELNIGFEYLSTNDNCTQDECTLLDDSYLLFNKETKKLPSETSVVLSQNGWYAKSQHEECLLRFDGSTVIEHCPDGRKSVYKFSKKSLEGTKLSELDPEIILQSDLKDPKATFTYDTSLYEVSQSSQDTLYEFDNNDVNKCYIDKEKQNVVSEEDFSKITEMFCSIDNVEFHIDDLNKSTGIITNEDAENIATWKKVLKYDVYNLIELNFSSNGKQYFLAPYNGLVRVGLVTPQKNVMKYINTEAFNVVYTQLKDKYTDTFKIYENLQDGYYRMGVFGNKKWYQKFSIDAEDNFKMSYRDFSDYEISENWILTNKGMNRESLVCDSQYYFQKLTYSCEDGRNGEFALLDEKTLKNDLILNYIEKENLNLSLYNEDKFFSIDAKEFTIKHKSNSGVSYIFNVEESYDVGTQAFTDGATSFDTNILYISEPGSSAYIQIQGLKNDTNGTAILYKSYGAEVDDSILWKKITIADKQIVLIEHNELIEKYMHTKKSIVLVEFSLAAQRVISGYLNYDETEYIEHTLNSVAHQDILNNL